MAFFPEDGDVVQFTIQGEMLGQKEVTVLHYLIGGVTGVPTSTQVLEALRQLVRTELMPLLNTEYFVRQYLLDEVTGVTGTDTTNARLTLGAQDVIPGVLATDGGTVSAGPLPTYASGTVRKLTGGAGTTQYIGGTPVIVNPERRFNGRIAVPGMGENDTEATDGNALIEASRTAIEAAYEALRDWDGTVGLNGIGGAMVVLSLVKDGLVRVTAGAAKVLAYQQATSLTMNSWLGSQLSRKYRGPA